MSPEMEARLEALRIVISCQLVSTDTEIGWAGALNIADGILRWAQRPLPAPAKG